jgi:tetrahydromethanopterin S-methyltransferase subunit G
MKIIFISLFLILNSLNCFAISEDTKVILGQMDKRFEQINKRFEQIDKRFEQIDKRLDLMQHNMDKRFDQVDKRFEETNRRFETVFNILYILMGLIFASPFIAIYLRDKKDLEDKKNFDIVKGMLYTLRELAQDDEKIAKSLRAASLL